MTLQEFIDEDLQRGLRGQRPKRNYLIPLQKSATRAPL